MERQIEDLWRKPSKARSSCRAKFKNWRGEVG